MKKKQSKDSQLEKRLQDLEEKWKRALADYANLEKRIEKEKKNLAKFANAGLIDKLLPVLDNLERCSRHLKDKGLQLVLNQFKQILASEGVEEIKAEGKKFDPLTMDAVAIEKGPKDRVLAVVTKGYFLKGRVLRPAKVKVGSPEIDKQKVNLAKKGQQTGDYL